MRLKKAVTCVLVASLITGCSANMQKKGIRILKKVERPRLTPKPEFLIPVTDENIYYLAKWIYADVGHAKDDYTLDFSGVKLIKKIKIGQEKSIKDAVASIDIEPDERCMEIAEGLLRHRVERSFPDDLEGWEYGRVDKNKQEDP